MQGRLTLTLLVLAATVAAPAPAHAKSVCIDPSAAPDAFAMVRLDDYCTLLQPIVVLEPGHVALGIEAAGGWTVVVDCTYAITPVLPSYENGELRRGNVPTAVFEWLQCGVVSG